jgi:hypothetical protein
MLTGLRTGLIIVVFLSILCFPLLNEKFKLIKDLPNTENRRLARKPKLTENNYDVFPMKYEKYYNDHFSIRSYMLRYFNLYNIDVLQKSPLPDKLVIGKDGWLFMNETYMDAYTGKDSLTAQELEAFKQELEYRNEYLKQRNCKFYVMISPSKATVYNDLLPSSVYKITKQSWGEALLSYLQKNSSVKTINVFDELKSNAHKKQLYYKTDTHYSGWGGLYAANEFLKKINTDYADIIPFDINEFDENKTPKIKGNISDLLGNIKNFDDYVYELTPKKGIVAHTVNNIGYPCVDDFPYCDDFSLSK